jgi:hypothetical protein
MFLSASIVYYHEDMSNPKLHSWGNTVYLTWMTMATVGGLEPVSGWGKLLKALDALDGLLLIGLLIWLLTVSLQRESYWSRVLRNIYAEEKRKLNTDVASGSEAVAEAEQTVAPGPAGAQKAKPTKEAS